VYQSRLAGQEDNMVNWGYVREGFSLDLRGEDVAHTDYESHIRG